MGDRPGHGSRDEIYYTQIVVITAMIVFATGFLAAARVLVPVAGTAAWISVLIGGAFGLGIAVLAGYLARAFPITACPHGREGIRRCGQAEGLTFTAYCTVVLGLIARVVLAM